MKYGLTLTENIKKNSHINLQNPTENKNPWSVLIKRL